MNKLLRHRVSKHIYLHTKRWWIRFDVTRLVKVAVYYIHCLWIPALTHSSTITNYKNGRIRPETHWKKKTWNHSQQYGWPFPLNTLSGQRIKGVDCPGPYSSCHIILQANREEQSKNQGKSFHRPQPTNIQY